MLGSAGGVYRGGSDGVLGKKEVERHLSEWTSLFRMLDFFRVRTGEVAVYKHSPGRKEQ